MTAITHIKVEGSERVPLPGAVAKGRVNPHKTIDVSIKLRRKKELPDLTDRPTTQMSRDELAQNYGASNDDILAVERSLERFGLKPVAVNPAARLIRFRGSAQAMEQAFQVKLLNYAHATEEYRGRVGSVGVPSEIHHIVKGIFGLDNRRVARHRRNPPHHGHSKPGPVPSSWYLPGELARHYNFPGGDGQGQAVGLLEFGGGYFPDDLKKFCKIAQISPIPKVVPISTDGTPTDRHDGEEGEVMLDVEVVAGVCPKSTIVVYFAQFTEQGWITALDAAVHDKKNKPGVISISWGYAEDNLIWTRQAMREVNETLKEAAMLGITVCVSAGDDGSSDGITDGHAHADFPATSPYVLAVGGTTIPGRGGNQPDIVWKEGDGLRADGGGSSGGGPSAVFLRPTWQAGIAISSVNPGAIIGRCIPDLSANADWTASPYLLVVNGRAEPNGGTSAASPLMAGLFTLMNAARPAGKRVGYITPLLYKNGAQAGSTVGATACRDVVSGDINTDQLGGYASGPGYDAASGWGTPDGAKLATLIPA